MYELPFHGMRIYHHIFDQYSADNFEFYVILNSSVMGIFVAKSLHNLLEFREFP